jgi:hypothetical protein
MKLKEAVSWLMGSLQRNLFHHLEECWERVLSNKEQQLVSILELLQIERYAGRPSPKRFGRKRRGRRAMARAFMGKAVYKHPTTRTTPRGLAGFSGLPGHLRFCEA